MSNRFLEAYEAEFEASLESLLAESPEKHAFVAGGLEDMGKALSQYNHPGQAGPHPASFLQKIHGHLDGIGKMADEAKAHVGKGIEAAGKAASGAGKAIGDVASSAGKSFDKVASHLSQDVAKGAGHAAFALDKAAHGSTPSFTVPSLKAGSGLKSGLEAGAKGLANVAGKALEHPRGVLGAAGLGLVGATALAHKAYTSLRGEGNHEPTPDELHERMKKHHEEGGGGSNSGNDSAGSHPGEHMTFGRWTKNK
jgi:hypothetical protein